MGNDQNQQYDSDTSEPEIAKLFNGEKDIPEQGQDSRIPDSRMTENSVKSKNLTPTFLVEMRKRQQERAERREEIKRLHQERAEEKRRQTFEAETLRQGLMYSIGLMKIKDKKEGQTDVEVEIVF